MEHSHKSAQFESIPTLRISASQSEHWNRCRKVFPNLASALNCILSSTTSALPGMTTGLPLPDAASESQVAEEEGPE